MRQIIDTGTKTVVNVEKLSQEFIIELGKILNTPEMVHIENVYFTKNGSYWWDSHEYKGNDKQYKGKKYAKFRYQNVKKDTAGVEKWVRLSLPDEEFLIVKEYEATYFVDEYVKSLKK